LEGCVAAPDPPVLRAERLAPGNVMGAGRLAQLGERFPYKEEVGGSSPSAPTSPDFRMKLEILALGWGV
jgi:hypothetical protein